MSLVSLALSLVFGVDGEDVAWASGRWQAWASMMVESQPRLARLKLWWIQLPQGSKVGCCGGAEPSKVCLGLIS